MKNPILRYGVIAGVLGMVLSYINWYLIAQPFGYNASAVFGYASILVSLTMVYFGIRYFRDIMNEGTVTFGKGFTLGLGISLIASLFMFLHSVIFFSAFGDAFMEWSKASFSEAEWEMRQQQMEAMGPMATSAVFQGFVMFLTVFVIGLIVSLISAAILKKEGPKLDPA